jgi:DNA processing protein
MLAIELARRKFWIIREMAYGIDKASHEGALAANKKITAIFENGIDIIYPIENTTLYKRIAEKEAIIFEFTLGRGSDGQTFPIRSRLIAGLCHAIIVVKSDKFGGNMITAKFAIEYGRYVFAVPRRINQPSSSGRLALIKEATMLTCVDGVFEDLPHLDDSSRQALLPFASSENISLNVEIPKFHVSWKKGLRNFIPRKVHCDGHDNNPFRAISKEGYAYVKNAINSRSGIKSIRWDV